MKALAQKTFSQDKAKEFKTKSLRSFYNSALLRASISPQELKDLMFGHGRKGARGHYDYDELTIKEAYGKVFEHVSINGLQVRADLKKVMDTLKGLTETQAIFQRELEKKDQELQATKSQLDALNNMIKQIANSDSYKTMAEGIMEKVAKQLTESPEFMEKIKKDAEKLKSGYFNPNKE